MFTALDPSVHAKRSKTGQMQEEIKDHMTILCGALSTDFREWFKLRLNEGGSYHGEHEDT